MLQRVLKVQQNQLGSAHPDTVVTLEHLAGTCLADGKLEEALHLFTQVHEAKISKFGSDSTETLGTLMNLALVYDELGNVSEATHILEKVSFEFAKTLGPQHPDTLLATYNLAIAWSQGGEAEKALVLCEKAALVFEALDFLHRSAYPMVQTLIRWCRRSGKFSQAEAWRNKWLAKTGKTIPSEEDGTKERMQIWRSRWGLELMRPPTLGLLSVGVGEEKFGVVP